ncbi:hypothetical protein RUND412_008413 [Rhizina undulata]
MATSNLYGAPRPKSKSTAIPLSSTSIHALSTELTLARSRLDSTAKSAPARSRPAKKSLFAPANKGVKTRAERDLRDGPGRGGNMEEISERELERSRKKLKEKANVYRMMKRGEVEDGEGLVDFDRKWAQGDDVSDDEEEHAEEDGEMVEYEDEFGRTRMGSRKEAEREGKRKAAEKGEAGGEEERNLIFGNTVQTNAFRTATFSSVPTTERLAEVLMEKEKEERVETHYDASKEVRTKGVGFYQFSTDEAERKREMEELERERVKTEAERIKREEGRKRRREEVEKRREEVRKRRRGQVGANWLEGFMGDMGGNPSFE